MKSIHNTKTKIFIGLELLLIVMLAAGMIANVEAALLNAILIVLLLYNLKSKSESITIDDNGITIKNWITIEKRSYRFEQFDTAVKYIDSIETLGRLDMYLLKDNIIFCKIRGKNFKNFNELFLALEERKIRSMSINQYLTTKTHQL